MATVDYMTMPTDVISAGPEVQKSAAEKKAETEQSPQMHRIRTVRLQQGTSLRSVARQSGVEAWTFGSAA